jgi:hypothetical protein
LPAAANVGSMAFAPWSTAISAALCLTSRCGSWPTGPQSGKSSRTRLGHVVQNANYTIR